MNFTPNDLQNISIKKSFFGGCKEEIVKDVLYKIIEDYNSYIHENVEIKDKLSVLNDGIQYYKNLEESIQNAILIAQQTSEEIKKNSYEKADNILKEAEIKAKKIIDDANLNVTKLRNEYDEVKKTLHVYRAKSESLINSQLEMLKEICDSKELKEIDQKPA